MNHTSKLAHSAMMEQQLNLLVVDWGNLLQGGGVIYKMEFAVLESNSNLLFLWGGGGNLLHIKCYTNY